MARTILGTKPALELSPTSLATRGPTLSLSPQQVEARLRQQRSRKYIDAVTKLDAGSHVHSKESVDELLREIGQELHELSAEFWPIGYVSKCYLGEPYEVHSLDRTGNIICHYKVGQSLPNGMERARTIARHPQYAFIEVYSDKLIAVTQSGDVSLIKG